MKLISWKEAKEITESFFAPYKCVVDKRKSDYQNVLPFVIYYDHSKSCDRYGPHIIEKFNKKDLLEKILSAHKMAFNETIKSQ